MTRYRARKWLVVAIGPRRPVLIECEGHTQLEALRDAYGAMPAGTVGAWMFRGTGGPLAALYIVSMNDGSARKWRLNPEPDGGRVPRKDWRAFKTGMSYRDVYYMLSSPDPDTSTWHYKRRGTVLGMWHAIKLEMWKWANRHPEDPGLLMVEGGAAGVSGTAARDALRGARIVEGDEEFSF